MRTWPLIGLLTICLCSGASFPVWYSPRLKVSSPADLDNRLAMPFSEGTAHPARASNCVQLLAQHGQTPQVHAPDREIQAERSTMANCMVLQELHLAKPARSSYLRDLKWDEHVLSLLPPLLAITVSIESERAASAAAGHGLVWPAFDPSVTAAARGANAIVVSGNGFREQLILWGRGDFNGDGADDLLVQSLDTLTEGTYRNTRLFVLTRNTANGPLSLVRSLL